MQKQGEIFGYTDALISYQALDNVQACSSACPSALKDRFKRQISRIFWGRIIRCGFMIPPSSGIAGRGTVACLPDQHTVCIRDNKIIFVPMFWPKMQDFAHPVSNISPQPAMVLDPVNPHPHCITRGLAPESWPCNLLLVSCPNIWHMKATLYTSCQQMFETVIMAESVKYRNSNCVAESMQLLRTMTILCGVACSSAVTACSAVVCQISV